MTTTDSDVLRAEYSRRSALVLDPLASRLEAHLRQLLGDELRVDSVRVRAKSVDRFLQKAFKQQNGHAKYADPLNQIQDQVGARVPVARAPGRSCAARRDRSGTGPDSQARFPSRSC